MKEQGVINFDNYASNHPKIPNKGKPPTKARERAQLKQVWKLAKCPHPNYAITEFIGVNGGYFEYCTDCDKVTYVH